MIKIPVKEIFPPIFYKIYRKLTPKPFSVIYENWEEAIKDTTTYEDKDIIKVVSAKTTIIQKQLSANNDYVKVDKQLVQNMFVLSFICNHKEINPPLNVLEIGGACGAGFFQIDTLLPGVIANWHIVETPMMAEEGRKLFQNEKIKFFDSIHDTNNVSINYDLVMVQGTLQYVPDIKKTISQITNTMSKFIYITRAQVGIGTTEKIITKQVSMLSQRIPHYIDIEIEDKEVSIPLTIIPLKTLRNYIIKGCNIIFEFDEEGEYPSKILFKKNKVITKFVGFLSKTLN